jgi:serine/threonine protein kinase
VSQCKNKPAKLGWLKGVSRVSVAESDRYQFVKDLGSGAMGRVSLALDRVSGELVAIKRLHEVVQGTRAN